MRHSPRARDLLFARAVWGIVLAPVALVSAPVWLAGVAFTPIVFTGGKSVIGVAFTISGFIAFFGLVLSLTSILDARTGANTDPRRKGRIMRAGTWGLVLNILTMFALVGLWMWIPVYGLR